VHEFNISLHCCDILFDSCKFLIQLLDKLLGKGHFALMRRAELKTLVDMHGNEVGINFYAVDFIYVGQFNFELTNIIHKNGREHILAVSVC
jgi:hypothetical protein